MPTLTQPYTWSLERLEGRRWLPVAEGGVAQKKVQLSPGEYRVSFYDSAGERHVSTLRVLAHGEGVFPWYGWWPEAPAHLEQEGDDEPASDASDAVRRMYRERYALAR